MAPKKSTATKEVKPEAEPVVVPVVKKEDEVEAPVVTETVEVDKFAVVIETLQKFQNEIKDILSVVKNLQKDHVRLLKTSSKKSKKSGGSSADGTKRQPSGFAKPTLLSNQLCDFLGVAHSTSMARTEVTRMINEYIKAQKLQDPKDKRKIIPDAKLKAILKIDDSTVLSYFNLQSHLKGHFTKATA
jgi:chromatin remodeling complex protein RSC6